MRGAKNVAMLKAARISLGGNLVLFILKLTALVMVHSLAIATDLGITVAGLVVSVVLYQSLRVSNRPADLIHNYGYGKIEHVCEALEGVVLIGIAMVMSVQAVIHLIHKPGIALPWLGLGFSMTSAIINFAGARWILIQAKISRSPAVFAEGIHYRLEGYISLTIAAAFLLTAILAATPFKLWAPYLDPAATLIVSVWIIAPSFKMAKHAILALLDSSLEEGSKLEVMKQLGKYLGRCCEFRDIRSRHSGRKKFVECGIVLPKKMSFSEAHKLAGEIEKSLERSISGCQARVHMIPCDENCAFRSRPEECQYFK